MHNVEKSKFQKGMYVGYGGGAVWHIRSYGKGNWKATPQGNNSHKVFTCATLRDVSTQLETLNAPKAKGETFAELVKSNPAKRAPKKAPSARVGKTRKQYVSRPSQAPGHKAPSVRLQARRKLALVAPKGYFPNPKKEPVFSRVAVQIDSGNGWEYYVVIEAPGKLNAGRMAIKEAKYAAKLHPDWRIRVITK